VSPEGTHIHTPTQTGVSCKWVNDSQRLLLEWFDTIYDSPSQLYYLALPFCPSSSWLHKYYTTELSQVVRVDKGLPFGWGMCSRTVILEYRPLVLTCWKDIIAVGLGSWNIIILDGITGSQTAILCGHTGMVGSLTLSPNGASLVSGSHDKTIKLWDMQTGGVIKTFHGHTSRIISVSISADCTMIVSGSADRTIRLWNIQSEECHCVIEQLDWVDCVRFSPTDPHHLISVSDYKVKQWNTRGHQINSTNHGSHIAFSVDGAQLVLCQGEDIIVQNSASGAIITKFHLDSEMTNHCCFSPDGRYIAVASYRTAYIWDTATPDPHPIKTFIGHTDSITSLTFSSPSSLISASKDKSIKFWQIFTLPTDPVVTDLESTPLTSVPIRLITLQAQDGIATSIDFDGVVKTWDISTGLCKASFQTPAKNPSSIDVQLINNRLNLVYQQDKIHIWDLEMGELQTVDSTRDPIDDVKISGDGSKVLCLHWQSVQALSMQTGEVVGEVKLEHDFTQRSLTVDGSRVWVHSPSSEPMGWDFGTPGPSPTQLFNILPPHLTNTKLWNSNMSRIEDKVTGKVIFQLGGRFANPTVVQWDGWYLVAGYRSGEVLILDFNHIFL